MPFINKRTGKTLNQDMRETQNRFKNLVLEKLPDFLEHEAQKLVDNNFQNEQYANGEKWKARKKGIDGSKSRSDRRGLLVESGELVKSTKAGKKSKNITISSDVPYAEIHNEGKEGNAFGKHKFKMPQRQFMPIPGEPMPEEFDKKVEQFLDKMMDDLLS